MQYHPPNRTRIVFVSYLLVFALAFAPLNALLPLLTALPLGAAVANAQAEPQQPATPAATTLNNAVYLPLVTNKGSQTVQTPTPTALDGTPQAPTPTPAATSTSGKPSFLISTPQNNATVAGTLFFAVQALDAATITSVIFKAGNTILGTDSTSADGWRVFLDAKTLPAGPLQLSATASGPGGETTQSITVNVVANPPQSGNLASTGGVFSSQIGSVISFQPDSAPAGTQITVTELDQQQVTEQTNIDWDRIGVTFLGAQQVDSSVPLSRPFAAVASAGFGNRVQPGQAVVNYRVAPDADGDGVSEIVVVNTASVAPNGDVVADPLSQVAIHAIHLRSTNSSVVSPGKMYEIQTDGLNTASPTGNLVHWQSLANGKSWTVPGIIFPSATSSSQQTLFVIVPPLPAGPAVFSIENQSTGFSSNPITVTLSNNVIAAGAPALDTVNQFFDDVSRYLQTYSTSSATISARLTQLVDKLASTKQKLNELAAQNPSPEYNQVITDLAAFVQNSAFYDVGVQAATTDRSFDFNTRMAAAIGLVGAIGTVLNAAGSLIIPINPAVGASMVLAGRVLQIGAGLLGIGLSLCIIAKDGPCIPDPPKCTPAQASRGTTGMGSAPPPGGNGCGGANGPGGGSLFRAAGGAGAQSLAGQIAVKIYINGKATPFTGLTDAGGYFFIPLIPEGEPFTAVAYDTVSKQTRNFNGVGPKTGDSIYMFFDFADGSDASQVSWDGGGDGTSWTDPKNWSGDSVPVDLSHVTIADAPGRTIVISGNLGIDVQSIQSAAPVELRNHAYLDLHDNSSFSKGLTFQSTTRLTITGPGTIESGAGALVTIGGSALTVPSGAWLFAYGANTVIQITAPTVTLAPGGTLAAWGASAAISVTGAIDLQGGGLYVADGAQILLPQATTYSGDIRSLGYLNQFVPYDIEQRCFSSAYGGSAAICAVGSGSRIDLSGVTSLIGETWTGFFGAVDYLSMYAGEGGLIDLSNLTTITKGRIAAVAVDLGSKLNLGKLQGVGDRSSFFSKDQGMLDIHSLTDLSSATLAIENSTQIQTSQITTLNAGVINVDHSAPDFTNLASLNGAFLHATNGGKISLPKITNYGGDGRDFFTTLNAVGAGSLIEFPALTTLVGNTFVNDALIIQAKQGGQIKMGQLTVINGGKVQLSAEDSASVIDLPLLNTFLRDSRGESLLKTVRNGKINTPQLTTANGISLYFDVTATLDTAQLTDFTNGLLDVTAATPNLSSVANLNGTSIAIRNGGVLTLPKLATYDASGDSYTPAFDVDGAGSVLDLAATTTLTGDQNGNEGLAINAKNGGLIRLNQVTALAGGGRVWVTADGTNARVELKALTQISGGPYAHSNLTIRNGGIIDVNGNALTLDMADIDLDKVGQILVGPVQMNNDSWLIGNGALANSVTLDSGLTSPGASAGKLALGANYTQAGNSRFAVEIGGTAPGVTYDQLTVAGAAVLTGTLEISLINSYSPPLNTTFTILTAGALSGAFTTVNGADIGNGKKFQVNYTGNSVQLQVVAAP